MKSERNIYFRDLFIHVIKRWRIVLLVMLVFGFILPSISIARNMLISFTEEQIDARAEELVKTNSRATSLKALIESQQKKLNEEKAYLKTSILINIDPKAKAAVNMVISIVLTDSASVGESLLSFEQRDVVLGNLLRKYSQSLSTDDFVLAINEQTSLSLTTAQFNEIVDFLKSEERHVIHLMVYHKDVDSALTIAYAIYQNLKTQYVNSLQKYQRHTLELTEITHQVVADENITKLRQKKEDQINGLQEKIDEYKQELHAIAVNDLNKDAKISIPGSLVISLLLGAILALCLLAADFMLHPVVRSEMDLRNRVGLDTIAVVRTGSSNKSLRKQLLSPDTRFDRLILGTAVTCQLTGDLVYVASMFHQLVRSACEQISLSRCRIACLYLPEMASDAELLCQKIDLAIHELGLKQTDAMELTHMSDVYSSPQQLTELGKSDFVILIEKSGVSRYQRICKDLNLLNRLDKPVIGVFLLDDA